LQTGHTRKQQENDTSLHGTDKDKSNSSNMRKAIIETMAMISKMLVSQFYQSQDDLPIRAITFIN
jgi:hypothetical protein